MEQIPIITESVQYGVIGICIMLIIAWSATTIALVRYGVMAWKELLQEINSLNKTLQELTSTVDRLVIRNEYETRMINNGKTIQGQ